MRSADLSDTRYADDRQLNEEMRQVEHWDDPAAAFLTVSWAPYRLPLSSAQAHSDIHMTEKESQGTAKAQV
jgi:hypothetical protein